MFSFTPKSKLLAVTESGIDLGRVSHVETDQATGRINVFYIASSHVLPRLLDSELIIAWNQVIDWKQDKIIVSDTSVPLGAKNIALASPASTKAGAHLKEA